MGAEAGSSHDLSAKTKPKQQFGDTGNQADNARAGTRSRMNMTERVDKLSSFSTCGTFLPLGARLRFAVSPPGKP